MKSRNVKNAGKSTSLVCSKNSKHDSFKETYIESIGRRLESLVNTPSLFVEKDKEGLTKDIDILPGDRLIPTRRIAEAFPEFIQVKKYEKRV
jgi:hypothetical protein